MVQRRKDVVVRPAADGSTRGSFTSTAETVDGLLILEGDHLVVQWRVARKTDHVGGEIRSDSEIEPVQQVVLPLGGIATPRLRRTWRRWRRRWQVVVTAADLRTLEPLADAGGLQLAHAGEMIIDVRSGDRDAAAAFVKELHFALADEALRRAEAIDAGRPPSLEGRAPPRLASPDDGARPGD